MHEVHYDPEPNANHHYITTSSVPTSSVGPTATTPLTGIPSTGTGTTESKLVSWLRRFDTWRTNRSSIWPSLIYIVLIFMFILGLPVFLGSIFAKITLGIVVGSLIFSIILLYVAINIIANCVIAREDADNASATVATSSPNAGNTGNGTTTNSGADNSFDIELALARDNDETVVEFGL